MIDEFLKIVSYSDLRAKLKGTLKTFNHEEFPFSNYFGINYYDDRIESVKFYFILFKKIDEASFCKIFPFFQEVKDIYKEFKESKTFDKNNLGLTFGIKIDNKGTISYSFYQPFESPNPVGSKLNFPVIEKPVRENFFVKEFKEKYESFSKNYYLVANRENVNFMLNFFNVREISYEKVEMVEYAEFQNKKKMVMVISDYQTREKHIRQVNGNNFLKLLDYIQGHYKFIPDLPGYYHDSNLKTIYFFEREANDDFFKQSSAINKLMEKTSI